MYLFMIVLFPINGLFVVFLWSLTMCNLIQGYIATKNKNYLKGLAGLCLVNALYIPIVLHYKGLEYVNINIFFWVGNLLAALVVADYVRKICCIGRYKALILFVICVIPASIIMANNNADWRIGALYIVAAVVVSPICYLLYAKKQLLLKETQGENAKNEDTLNGE